MFLPTDINDNVLASIRDTTPSTVVEPWYMIVLCASCFQRGCQLRAAMGPNLAHVQSHQPYCARWMVLLCKVELEVWIKLHYNDYIKSGVLVLARAEPDVQSGCFHRRLSKQTHCMPQQLCIIVFSTQA